METIEMTIQDEIEARLADTDPEVEVLLAEVVGASTVRVFIDHPQGVTLALCERVSRELALVRERYALEVSSPGLQRPLTKPGHYQRYLGRRARIRTGEPVGEPGRKSFTGELVGASEEEVTIAAEDGLVSIPYRLVQRSNLIGD